MRSKFKWIFTLLVAFTMQFSFAQEKTITGTVSDATGPLPGVNVVVKGTQRGTSTNFDGTYSIKAKEGETLTYSFLGMKDVSMLVGASSSINVKMTDDSKQLAEVVIQGYGKTTTKAKTSIAQTTISAAAIEGRPNVSFLQSLQSLAPGMNVASASGSPGSAKIDVLIRGVNSASGTSEPLIVIDGVPANQASFRGLNTEDIESATVLKDAGATAVYGNRGANGVIVVKTKKGVFNSKMAFRFTSTTGFTTLQQHDYDIANSRETLTLERDFGAGGLGTTGGVGGGPMTDAEIAAFGIDTSWRDIFFRTGISKNNNLSITAGSEKMSNFTSFGYFDQQGIVPGTDFKRFSLRSNFTGKSDNDRFTYTTNISSAYSKRSQLDQETRTDINANILQNPLQGLLVSLPYLDPNVYQNGQQLFNDFGAASFQITPYMLMDYLTPGNIPSSFSELKLMANFSGTFKLTKDLSFTNTSGFDYAQNDRLFARAPQSYLAIVATPVGVQFGGVETQSTDKDFGFNSVNRLNYLKTFNEKHTIDLSVYTEYTKAHRSFYQYTQNGLDPRTWSLGAGTGYVPFNTATPTLFRPTVLALKRHGGLFAYFATADYDYDGRFGLVGTIRRDASYRFIEDKRWGTFWSVSGRWNVDREKFMENSWFNELKLRGSYGTTGNQNIQTPVPGGNPLFLAGNIVRQLNSTQSGYGNASSIGVALDAAGNLILANTDLQWETTTQADLGLDFRIKNKLSGTVDFYKKETTDLFDSRFLSAVNGTYSQDANTDSKLVNKGVELLLKYDIFDKENFKLDVFANASYNKNYYEDLVYNPGEDRIITGANTAQQNGGPINQYNVVPYLGVNPANGNLLFLDINNNVTETVTDADRRTTGKSFIPVYQGGFGFNASYKGIFLNSLFSWVGEVYRFDFDLLNMSDPTAIGVFAVTNDLSNAWTPTNTNTDVPSLTASNLTEGDNFSDRFLRDASYIRLKNVSLGYDVPKKYFSNTFIKGFKFYGQLENFVTWSKWRGLDPEGLNGSNQGGYPSPKVASVGLDLQF